MKEQYATLVEKVRVANPIIHHITNYVTVNDCANITLAIGGSPIMADALEEAADITGISSALVLNMGTLNERTVTSMLAAGRAANKAKIPVIFDPVGAGASKFRNDTAASILEQVQISVLRGNISEIRFLAGLQSETKGVDASKIDMEGNAVSVAKSLATKLNCVVAITGAVDAVSDGTRTICIENGHPKLADITGTGCMCSSLIGSFCGAVPNSLLEGTVSAILTMGIAGEMANELVGTKGNGSFRIALHDFVSRMDADIIKEKGKCYEA